MEQPLDVQVYARKNDDPTGDLPTFIASCFNATTATFKSLLLDDTPAIIQVVRGNIFLYVAICLIRSLFGRATVGILVRPAEIGAGSAPTRTLRLALLKLLKRIPQTSTLATAPLLPGLDAIVDGWIVDPRAGDPDAVADRSGTTATASTAATVDGASRHTLRDHVLRTSGAGQPDGDSGHSVRKNVWFTLLSFVISIGITFISYRVLIMQGGIGALALWATVFAWTSLIRMADVGMTNAALRFAALCDPQRERDRLGVYIETGILANAALFAVLSVVGYWGLSSHLPAIVGAEHLPEVGRMLPIMMFGFWITNVASVVLGSLQGIHLGYVKAQLIVAGNLLQAFCVILLVPSTGLVGMALAQAAQFTMLTVVGWAIIRKRLDVPSILPLRFGPDAFREMFAFSVKSQLANIANGLFEPVSKILVGQLGGLTHLGLYELAFKTLWLPRTGIVSGVSATQPALTSLLKEKSPAVWPLYAKSTRYATRAVLAAAAAIVLTSPLISLLWLGKIDRELMVFLAILSFGIVVNSWGAAAYNLGTVTGRMRNNIIVNGLTLIALIGAMYAVHALQLGPIALIAAISLTMAAGAAAIRFANERLLKRMLD